MRRKNEADRLMVRVQQDQQSVIQNPVAAGVDFFDGVAGEPQSEATGESVVPVIVRHFFPIRLEPGQVFDLRAADLAALKKYPAPENRMLMKQSDQQLGEF